MYIVDPTPRITIPAGLDAAPARLATVVNFRPSLGLYNKMRFGKCTVP
jgi:hypothetical protein